MNPQVEAAFDAWLASMGMNRNSPIPYGQEGNLLASWEAFLLNYGAQQGRTIVAAPPVSPTGVYNGPPGGSFNVPVVQGGFNSPLQSPMYQPRNPSGAPYRVAAPVGGGGGGTYTPPPAAQTAPRFSVRPGG